MSILTSEPRLAALPVDDDGAAHQRRDLTSLIHDPVTRARALAHLLTSRPDLERVRPGSESLAVAGEIIVIERPGRSALRELGRSGFTVVERRGPLLRLSRPGAPMGEVLAVITSLRRRGLIAAPNYVGAVAGAIGKGLTGLATARPTSTELGARALDDRRGLGVRVAVVDTGIDPDAVNQVDGWLSGIEVDLGNRDELLAGPSGELASGAGHGTFVAGVVRQFAPSSSVQAVKALGSDGIGTDWSVAGALFDLAESDQSTDLVNLSLNCFGDEIAAPAGIIEAIDTLIERHPQTVIVAAAGNDGSSTPTWPGAHKSVLCVGSSSGEEPSVYSNRGHWVDFSAPADGVVSTYVRGHRSVGPTTGSGETEHLVYEGQYASWSGTSFAAPQITGLLADLISQGLEPGPAVAELRRRSTPTSEIGRSISPT